MIYFVGVLLLVESGIHNAVLKYELLLCKVGKGPTQDVNL